MTETADVRSALVGLSHSEFILENPGHPWSGRLRQGRRRDRHRGGSLRRRAQGTLFGSLGVAAQAAHCRLAAGEWPVTYFGARRMHPAFVPATELAAYLGGCDGEAGALGAEKVGIPATGTLPRALALILGSTAQAAKAFDKTIDPEGNYTILIDFFEDEMFFGALIAARAIPDSIFAVRLDIPVDRRGDFVSQIREVRWALDRAGFSITLLNLDDEMKGYSRGRAK